LLLKIERTIPPADGHPDGTPLSPLKPTILISRPAGNYMYVGQGFFILYATLMILSLR
jgi:hypothetical protein